MPTKNVATSKKRVFGRSDYKHELEEKRDKKKEHSPYIPIFLGLGLVVVLLFAGIGIASATTKLFYEGAKFPSPHHAPINSPYFVFDYMLGQKPPEDCLALPHITTVEGWQLSKPRYDAWWNVGVIPLYRTYASSGWTEEQMYQNYRYPASNGYCGMAIDEYPGAANTLIANSVAACRRIKQEHPDFFIFAWYYWALNSEQIAGQDVLDLNVAEAYISEDNEFYSVIDNYINPAQAANISEKTIIGLSAYTSYGTPERIDQQMQYVREQAPEMPGIAFFRLTSPYAWEDRHKYDNLVKKHFFDPSPAAEIISPHNDYTVSGTVKISVSATPNSGTNSPIVSYRYFIDNECVRISPDSEYLWNTAGYSEGSHIITVHAVAEDYLAGVSQIEVIVGEAATGTISGTVTDKDTGNPIEGATVTANEYSATTNTAGQYTLSNIPVGTYTVTASKTDYFPESGENVEVLEDQTTTVNFQMTEAPDLVGLWHFDEGSGTTAGDSSEYGNNGTLVNGPAWVDGKVGKALSFDGVDDYVDCGNDSSLNITGSITIIAWIKPAVAGEGGPNAGPICKAESGVDWSWQLRYNAPGGYMGFKFNGDPEGSTWVSVKQNLSPGEWYHIAGTFDGTNIKCYLNGVETDTNQISAIKGGSSTLFIGQDGWDNIFNGTIDEVKIYNKALSAEEIKADYEAGSEEKNPPARDTSPPLVTNPAATPATILLNDNSRPRVPGTNISQLNVTVTDDTEVDTVTIDLSPIGGSTGAQMSKIPGTDIWSVTTNATAGINLTHNLIVTAADIYGNSNTSVSIQLTVRRRGDVFRDNVVDMKDATYIARYLAGSEPEVSNLELVGDVVGKNGDPTGDGVVDMKDAAYIARYEAGFEDVP